eukprot:TRINITY_DN5780_c0_g1_i1.p1 TRINITY_DN5780_c0_g1~~TRINITY_DN5780_c0_g1_i1.p1  ORF type:complete len:330 (-),score=95.03 TRINITY_DN5780_c0_g1_i1:125-1057(-)
MEEKEKGKALSTVMISLIVLRNGDKFLATHETRGWYLPAGRVDFGETFETGAKRECLEEAGLKVKLDGILRVEQCADPRQARLRVVYSASPLNPNDSPRSKETADEEIIEACWLTVDELKTKTPIRSSEVVRLFDWVRTKNPPLLPCSIFSGTDGPFTSSNHVISGLYFRIVTILINQDSQIFCSSSTSSLISFYCTNAGYFTEQAEAKFKSKFKTEVVSLGLLHIHHIPPESLKATGQMTVYVQVELKNSQDLKQLNSNKEGKWEQVSSVKTTEEQDGFVIRGVVDKSIVALGEDRFCLEGTPFGYVAK